MFTFVIKEVKNALFMHSISVLVASRDASDIGVPLRTSSISTDPNYANTTELSLDIPYE